MYLWYLPVAKRNGMLNKPLDLENVTLLGHLKAGSYESKKVDAVVIKCSAPHRTDWGYEKEMLRISKKLSYSWNKRGEIWRANFSRVIVKWIRWNFHYSSSSEAQPGTLPGETFTLSKTSTNIFSIPDLSVEKYQRRLYGVLCSVIR